MDPFGRVHHPAASEEGVLTLASARSMRISLEAVHTGRAGLNAHRQRLLERAPRSGDWAKFPLYTLELKDLAYLTARCGDEFALLRGRRMDVLFHGDRTGCTFRGELWEMLMKHQLMIVGHSHPGEETPLPSRTDREALRRIGQERSMVISAVNGRTQDFGWTEFENRG